MILSSIVNARSLLLEYVRLLHEVMFVSVLMYENKKMIRRENKIFRNRHVHTNNFT